MATIINIEDLTSNVTVDANYDVAGNGVFDDLMETVNKHVKAQYDSGRLTAEAYGATYLGAIQTVLAQSVQFVLTKQLQEAQTDGVLQDNLLKAQQVLQVTEQRPELLTKIQAEIDILQSQDSLVKEQIESENLQNRVDGIIENQIAKLKADVLIAQEQVNIAKSNVALERAKAIASIDKEYGYNYTLDNDGNIQVLGSSDDGKLDAEIEDILGSTALKDAQKADIESQKDLKLLSTQLGAWTSLYNNHKITGLTDVVDTSNIEATYASIKPQE